MSYFPLFLKVFTLAALAALTLFLAHLTSASAKRRPVPMEADVAYDDENPTQKLDIYRAKSEVDYKRRLHEKNFDSGIGWFSSRLKLSGAAVRGNYPVHLPTHEASESRIASTYLKPPCRSGLPDKPRNVQRRTTNCSPQSAVICRHPPNPILHKVLNRCRLRQIAEALKRLRVP